MSAVTAAVSLRTPKLIQQSVVVGVGGHHHDVGWFDVEMPQDQREGAPADRAEADHDHGAGQAPVSRVLVHGVTTVSSSADTKNVRSGSKPLNHTEE